MIQKFKLTFVLLILNAIAFTALFILSNDQYKDLQKAHGLNSIISFFTQDLDSLLITSDELEESIKILRKNNNWIIDQPTQWPANNFSINQIIHQLNLLKESAEFTYDELIETDQNLKDFGLDKPKLVFNLVKGSNSLNLQVGNSTLLGNKLYLYLPEKKAIYIVESDLLNDNVLKIKDLYRKQIFDIPNFEINSLNYQFLTSETESRGQLSVRLEKNSVNHSWQFKSPLNVEADALLVAKNIQALTASEIEKFLPPEIIDSEMLGFENPSMKISLQGNKRRNTLILGKSFTGPNNTKSYYAKLEDNATVFTVKGSEYDQFIQAHKDLREKNFIELDTSSISTVDISNLENQTKLQKLENGTWQVLSLNEKTPAKPFQADSEVIKNFIRNLNTLRAVDFFADNPTEENLNALNFNAPLLKIIVFSNEENILTLNAVQHPNNETLLLAKTQNDPTIYTVDKASYIKNFSAESLVYKNRIIEKLPEVARIAKLQLIDIKTKTLLLDYPLNQPDESSTSTLINLLRELKVDRYLESSSLNTEVSEQAKLWKFKLHFEIALPSDQGDKFEERTYYISERSSGSLQFGSVPSQNRFFQLSQDLIDAIHPFINSFESTPESTDQAIVDPTIIEEISEINGDELDPSQ